MNVFKEQTDKITNQILNDLQNVQDFNDWGKDINDLLELIDDCQKEVDNKLVSIEGNYKSAVAEKQRLKAKPEEQINELRKIKQEYESAKEQRTLYHKEYQKQEQLCNDCEKEKEISSHDKELLFMTRKKYYIFKEMTNLIWDYTIPLDKKAAGHVRNKSKSYIKLFEFNKSQLTPTEIAEKIWNEIEISSQEECTNIEKSKDNKENISNN